MFPVPISTVDELLKLGGKIAEIVTVLLNRKATTEEQKQAQIALDEFNRFKRSYSEIGALVEQYNRKLAHAILENGVQSLFSLCTHEGFKEAERIHAGNVQNKVSYQELAEFELLSVKLITQMVKESEPLLAKTVSQQWASAYTREKWITVWQNNAKSEQEVVNRYWLAWQDAHWKIHGSEVFSQARI